MEVLRNLAEKVFIIEYVTLMSKCDLLTFVY